MMSGESLDLGGQRRKKNERAPSLCNPVVKKKVWRLRLEREKRKSQADF